MLVTTPNELARIGTLIGDPTRAAIITALMDGRAFTASELAQCANVTPQTASSHLAMLADAKIIQVQRQGRHRYHRLYSPQIATMVEHVMEVALHSGPPQKPISVGPRNEDMRRARTCYDHFAGRLGVSIAEALVGKGLIELGDEAGLITDQGLRFFDAHGLSIETNTKKSKRPLCRPCLDWSERKPHIGGRLGAAIHDLFFDKRFVRRLENSRAVSVTPSGRKALKDLFGISRF